MSTDISFAATCPECADVDLAADQMWLVLADRPGLTHYAFLCPQCGRLVRHRANAATVAVLQCRVPVEALQVPAEALEVHAGAALTIDDLIDLMLALESGNEARPHDAVTTAGP
jgi:predicted RNA-binding Zn-ribbon protein involved in translation (DUF1610 family)